MDMLRTFFEKTEEDTSVYFKGKAIWKQGEIYRSYETELKANGIEHILKYGVAFCGKEVEVLTNQDTKS